MGVSVTLRTERKWVRSVPLLGHINPGLSRVQPENTDGGALAVCLHEGNGAIKRHRAVHLVFEDVGIVESVWFGIGVITAPVKVLDRKFTCF